MKKAAVTVARADGAQRERLEFFKGNDAPPTKVETEIRTLQRGESPIKDAIVRWLEQQL